MSSEWERVQVADLESRGILLVQDGNHGEYRPRPYEFGSGDTAFIRAADISDGRVLFESAEHINDVAVDRIRKGKAIGGDVIFSHKGTVGKLALTPLDSPCFVCSPQTTFWRTLDTALLDRQYLYCFMRSWEFRKQWAARKGETDMADYVSLTAQRNLYVILPPIEEQSAIGEILGAFDEKIELNRQMNHTLEAMAQAVFKSWFVDFDAVTAKSEGRQPYGMNAETAALFPSHFEESELGPIPEGWAVRDVYSVSKVIYGAPFSSTEFNSDGNGLPLLRIRDLATHEPSVYTDEEHPKGAKVEPGDLVVGMDGEFRAHIWHGPVSWLNQRVCKFVPLEKIGDPFVYFSILPALLEYERTKVGTTVIHLGKSDIDRIRIVVPEESLQKVFMLVAQPLFQRIVANGLESRTLQSIRDALLPKLLSGEIRVGQAEQIATEIA